MQKVQMRIVGSVKAIDVVLRSTAEKRIGEPVALKVLVDGRVREVWFSVSKNLKPRVRQLASVPEELVGRSFEFAVNEAGQIVAMVRIAM